MRKILIFGLIIALLAVISVVGYVVYQDIAAKKVTESINSNMTAALNCQRKVDTLMAEAKAAGFAHDYTTAINKENEAITETSKELSYLATANKTMQDGDNKTYVNLVMSRDEVRLKYINVAKLSHEILRDGGFPIGQAQEIIDLNAEYNTKDSEVKAFVAQKPDLQKAIEYWSK